MWTILQPNGPNHLSAANPPPLRCVPLAFHWLAITVTKMDYPPTEWPESPRQVRWRRCSAGPTSSARRRASAAGHRLARSWLSCSSSSSGWAPVQRPRDSLRVPSNTMALITSNRAQIRLSSIFRCTRLDCDGSPGHRGSFFSLSVPGLVISELVPPRFRALGVALVGVVAGLVRARAGVGAGAWRLALVLGAGA